jgi:hypothetical protein
MATSVALLLFLAALFGLSPAVETARAAESETALEGSGIHYPGGFDPNTVGEVKGKAYGLFAPREGGPVRFLLKTGNERYTVLASPAWYWNDLHADLPDGSEVSVRGSKALGKDMNLYIIAQTIRLLRTGALWVFRDEDGYPRWKGAAGMRGGTGGGSPMQRGGPGGGFGGMGGRRR